MSLVDSVRPSGGLFLAEVTSGRTYHGLESDLDLVCAGKFVQNRHPASRDYASVCVSREGVQTETGLLGNFSRSAYQPRENGAAPGSAWSLEEDQGSHEQTQYLEKNHGVDDDLRRYYPAQKNAVAATVLVDRVYPLWVGDGDGVVGRGVFPCPCRRAILEICAFPDLFDL
ncbi:hypothetical protein BDV25DRAFT_140099 [Aspergillus avenaceus]|uniref:Uncharacterized protein n=1 Tax=Aspergillus avenaceus TaxID=36643 RepID=A0A5N6TV82_ASPAV|nr:hypothetical protein BDV25DRAFT_140099 [Aspergillus avenaceus]